MDLHRPFLDGTGTIETVVEEIPVCVRLEFQLHMDVSKITTWSVSFTNSYKTNKLDLGLKHLLPLTQHYHTTAYTFICIIYAHT